MSEPLFNQIDLDNGTDLENLPADLRFLYRVEDEADINYCDVHGDECVFTLDGLDLDRDQATTYLVVNRLASVGQSIAYIESLEQAFSDDESDEDTNGDDSDISAPYTGPGAVYDEATNGAAFDDGPVSESASTLIVPEGIDPEAVEDALSYLETHTNPDPFGGINFEFEGAMETLFGVVKALFVEVRRAGATGKEEVDILTGPYKPIFERLGKNPRAAFALVHGAIARTGEVLALEPSNVTGQTQQATSAVLGAPGRLDPLDEALIAERAERGARDEQTARIAREIAEKNTAFSRYTGPIWPPQASRTPYRGEGFLTSSGRFDSGEPVRDRGSENLAGEQVGPSGLGAGDPLPQFRGTSYSPDLRVPMYGVPSGEWRPVTSSFQEPDKQAERVGSSLPRTASGAGTVPHYRGPYTKV